MTYGGRANWGFRGGAQNYESQRTAVSKFCSAFLLILIQKNIKFCHPERRGVRDSEVLAVEGPLLRSRLPGVGSFDSMSPLVPSALIALRMTELREQMAIDQNSIHSILKLKNRIRKCTTHAAVISTPLDRSFACALNLACDEKFFAEVFHKGKNFVLVSRTGSAY